MCSTQYMVRKRRVIACFSAIALISAAMLLIPASSLTFRLVIFFLWLAIVLLISLILDAARR